VGTDILFESTSHAVAAIEEAERVMQELDGKIIINKYYPGQSSTAIKNKVVAKWRP